jgi:prenyltransferase beta subunit
LCLAAQATSDRIRADPLQRKDELEYWLTEHLRLNGLYWGLTALHLLGHPDALPRRELLDFVFSCLHEEGGFGAAPGHDAHMLYTVSGVQILATLDAFAELDERVKDGRMKIGKCAYCSRTIPSRMLNDDSHCGAAGS